MIIIKDPLYGYVKFEDNLSPIFDSPVFQRLRRIKQVFGSDFVYPSANHTRFEHSLGVGYLAGKVADHLKRLLDVSGEEKIDREDKLSLILAGLLHDIGHGPFSHAFEGFLSRLGMNHEDFGRRIINEILADRIEKLGLDPSFIAELAAGYELNKAIDRPFMKQIIGSAIDVDKLDYLRRDSYHAGTFYGLIDVDRIIMHLRVFDKQLCVDEKAREVLESMLMGRGLAFEAIYYHKTSRSAQILIDKAINASADDLNLYEIKDDLNKYISLDDYSMWYLLLKNPKSKEYVEMLASRKLLKVAWEITGIADQKTRNVMNWLINPKVRNELEEIIAEEANVDRKYVAIDVPSLPNIPYRHWIGREDRPMEIPILTSADGELKIIPLRNISQFARAMEGYFYAIRVYTLDKFRMRVKEATTKIMRESAHINPENMFV